MLKKNAAGVPSLSPLPPPLAVFFCSHLCALSPRSERTEQANVLYRASRHAFLLHEPRGTGTRNKAPRTRLHEVNLPSETLKEKTHSMANLFSFLLPLCSFVNLGVLIFLSDSSGPLHLLSLCGQEKNNYYTRPRFNRGK